MNQLSCFAFVINHLEIQFDLPIEITSGYKFQRANESQIDEFRDYVKNLIGFTPHSNIDELPYERSYEKCGKSVRDTDTYALRPLERDKWKYYIIEIELSEMPEDKFFDLQLSSNISDSELVFDSFIYIAGEKNRTYYKYPNVLQRFFVDNGLLPPQSIKQENIQQIGSLYNLLKKTEREYGFIKKAITIFDSLRNTSIRDDLGILGLFIVIESLVTHKPGKIETYDSLIQQVSTKVPLISHRFKDSDVKCSEFFMDADEKTIWKKLYSYRSNIAHGRGSEVDASLQILKDKSNVFKFLQKITKHLIVQALIEPQLISDLRNC